jgi:tripartite-type tricarboxylate transporter receptor subunit TctC
LNETLPGIVVLNWYGMVMPSGAPRDVVTRLHAEIAASLKVPEIRQKLAGLGFDPVGSSPREFGAFRSTEAARWARVIKDANIRAE